MEERAKGLEEPVVDDSERTSADTVGRCRDNGSTRKTCGSSAQTDRRPAEAPPRQHGEGKVGMKPCPNHGAFDHCWIRESQFIEVTVDVFPMLQSGHYTQEESASKKQTLWFFLLLCFAF